jgi:hypothetical protein
VGPTDELTLGPEPVPLRDRWRDASRPQRIVAGLAALSITVGLGWYALLRIDGWLAERAERDAVVVEAQLIVQPSSMSRGGGRVDYTLAVRNVGPGPLLVSAARSATAWLQVQSTSGSTRPVEHSDTAFLPLTVLLDCANDRDPASIMEAVVDVTPASGRSRPVIVQVDDAHGLVGLAEWLCEWDPARSGVELSGRAIKTPA